MKNVFDSPLALNDTYSSPPAKVHSWFVATIMAYFMVVESEDAGVLDSISRSISITKGFKLIILSYSVIYMLITLISSSIPIISVIVDTFATPMFYIILALIYKECMVKDAEQ